MLSRDEIIVYDRPNLLGFTKVPFTNTNKVSLVRPEFFTLCFTFKFHIVQTPNGYGKKVPFGLHYSFGTHVKFSLHIGVVHKLRWQDFGFFWQPTPSVDIFYLMKVDKKSTFLDYLPPSLLNVVCEGPHMYMQSYIFPLVLLLNSFGKHTYWSFFLFIFQINQSLSQSYIS